MDNFYRYKRKTKPVRQDVVRQTLVKADFRIHPDKKKILKEYARINDKTFSDIMTELTDQAVEIIKQGEIDDL